MYTYIGGGSTEIKTDDSTWPLFGENSLLHNCKYSTVGFAGIFKLANSRYNVEITIFNRI